MNRKEQVKELFNNGAGRICFELQGDYVIGRLKNIWIGFLYE